MVRPALASGNPAALVHAVRVRWSCAQVCRLLGDPDVDVRRVSAVVLGLLGDRAAVPCLTRALRDEDEQVNQMAEHGLWTIWFRACAPEAAEPFRQGVSLVAVEDYRGAVAKFKAATALDPDFCEAFNQCAIAHYFLGQWARSLADCIQAVRLVPTHFGAIAGMGHCYTQMGDLPRALRCYRHALRINPRMAAIAKAIERLETKLRDANDASGEYLVDHVPG